MGKEQPLRDSVFLREDAVERSRLDELGMRITRELGEGGFGKVYLVERPNTPPFAAKVFSPLPEADRERAKTRFLRGAEILQSIQDERVVRVVEIHRSEVPVIEMEFIEDGSLHDRCRAGADLKGNLALVCEAAKTLAAIHRGELSRQDTVHRDVKPMNILIRGDEAVLADFDLAYAGGTDATGVTIQEDTREGRVFAAGKFMHPEFRSWFQNGSLEDSETRLKLRSPALDYYGLSATLFFVLTGQVPENRKLCERALSRQQERLEQAIPSTQLAAICSLALGGLADTLEEMPVDVDAFAQDLQAQLRETPPLMRWGLRILHLLLGRPLAGAFDFQSRYSDLLSLGTAGLTLILTLLPIAAGVFAFKYLGGPGATITVWTLSGVLRGGLGVALSLQAKNKHQVILQASTRWMHHIRHIATITSWAALAIVLVSTGAITFGGRTEVPGVPQEAAVWLSAKVDFVRPHRPEPRDTREKAAATPASAEEAQSAQKGSEEALNSTKEETSTERRIAQWKSVPLTAQGPADKTVRPAKIESAMNGGFQITLPELVCLVEFNSMTGNPSKLVGCQSRGSTQLRYPSFDVYCSDTSATHVVCSQRLTWIESGKPYPRDEDWHHSHLIFRLPVHPEAAENATKAVQ